MQLCPCQVSAKPAFLASPVLNQPVVYSDCCQPYHQGISKAETAERLMRTRYSAFVQVLPEYIVHTTLPAQQALLDIEAIEQWARETPWAGLEIVEHTPKLGKRQAQVEFKAYYTAPNGAQAAHHERSTFVKVKDKANSDTWYFLDPTTAMSVSQKQPCICGSGEKFKRCCGVYLV
ncbi:YchJ family protein [Psychrobacter sp. AH5]|uniref:YchJ family protein n=1 Tax=Psychrobacter sp. AH5 TaxID=2937433 RepID=UPI0033427AC1